ncbi:MAG: AmmeMemoRadiSam system protein A [Peptococcaceae bacterium]|jgi:AmmeMemoRadiSam system protein A|nr:AmmeMemoRadiSam system protein A [Peptococcaceae bacterium]
MLQGCLVPHPPLIIPGVGDGTEIPATRAAYERIAAEIAAYDPDTVLMISPHSIMYADYFHISPGVHAEGNFQAFRAPEIHLAAAYDTELAAHIAGNAEQDGLPAGFLGERDPSLDHGVMAPLWFFRSKRILRISLSGLSFIEHYRFGMCIRRAIDALGRKAYIVASGDMSHKLGGQYGFAQAGVDHDTYVRESIASSDILRLMTIDRSLAENAAECGLRSIMILCGILDGDRVKSEVLHYEAPYGVGYLSATFTAGGNTDSLLPRILAAQDAHIQAIRAGEDPFVRLARSNVEHFIRTHQPIPIPTDLPPDMLAAQAGVFVSIKKNGDLRGCIGTIAPTRTHIAAEIIQNGVSACSQDPRFEPITSDELDDLIYSVDVLFSPEVISDPAQLDVKKYGVIVTSGYKRGLLLPNLDGVNTVDEQIRIALSKGGISAHEHYQLERFAVIRHGGESHA